MTYISRAQNFEDYRLFRALSHVEKGLYVDIGAWDPKYHSVSHNFYESGWRGVNIEPLKDAYIELTSQRLNDVNIQAFVTCKNGPVQMYQLKKSGLSSGNLQQIEILARNPLLQGTLEEVPPIRLMEIFDLLGGQEIHWLKIDVEGAESEVLASWGDSKARPWIVLVEATQPGGEFRTEDQWSGYLIEKQYEFTYFDGLNSFYVHQDRHELKASLSKPISIFDDVIKQEEYSLRLAMEQILAKSNQANIWSKIGFLGQPQIELMAQEILSMEVEIQKFTEIENLLVKELSDLESSRQNLVSERDILCRKVQELEELILAIQDSRIFRVTLPVRQIYFYTRQFTFRKLIKRILRSLAIYIFPRNRLRRFLQRNLPSSLQLRVKRILQTETSQPILRIRTSSKKELWDPEFEYLIQSVRSPED